jgi:hypothetical protein
MSNEQCPMAPSFEQKPCVIKRSMGHWAFLSEQQAQRFLALLQLSLPLSLLRLRVHLLFLGREAQEGLFQGP